MIFNYYKWASENKAISLKDDLDKAIAIMNEYNLIEDNIITDSQYEGEMFLKPNSLKENFYYKKEEKNKIIYDFFIDNLHIHVSNNGNEKIYSIRIKNSDDKYWSFNIDDKGKTYDLQHPNNQNYEVYVWYNIPVLDITFANGFVYKHGNWDKYIIKTLKNWFSVINSCTTESQINECYKCKKEKSFFTKLIEEIKEKNEI